MKFTEKLLRKIESFSDLDLRIKICQWLEWDQNEKTWNEIADLVEKDDKKRLSELLSQRQCFGTAGIRGIMGAGFNSMNDLVIIQTSQGLAKYLGSMNQDQRRIIIGYDGRHNSKRFASLAANVFLTENFQVELFSHVVPTPFVAFGTKLLKCSAGIVITASHNPKAYNGYKVFGSNGAQILSPHDVNIQKYILQNLKPWNNDIWNESNLKYDGTKLQDPLNTVFSEYYKALLQTATHAELVEKSDVKVTYTPLHGVGGLYLTKMFKTLGAKNYYPVESQIFPDPNFPTVDFPNPEEGKGVLNESFKTAEQNGSELIFANDPDSDRFTMAELVDGEWRTFNGNELGALFGWWVWNQFLESSDAKSVDKTDCYMISSAVSSKILETYAKNEGFNFRETLTGFKWMANLAYDLECQGKRVLFAFEEAIGFMIGTMVLDKDGISAAATALQMAAYLRSKGLTFSEQLRQIYNKYGFHFSLDSYYLCYDPEKVKKIFDNIANISGKGEYIKDVDGIKVVRVRDLSTGYDSGAADQKATLPHGNTMVTFYFENGSVITVRTSGTEPKIKYYSQIIADPSEKDWDKVKVQHEKLIESTVQILLQPKENELIAKKA